eukprot:COSAG06_NODE_2181_length_7402_cov_8.928933_5_plen_127_part_00
MTTMCFHNVLCIHIVTCGAGKLKVEDMFVAKYQQHPSTTANGKNKQQQQQKKNKKKNKQSKKNDAAAGGDSDQQGLGQQGQQRQGQQGQQGQPGLEEHEDGSAWSFVVPLNPPAVRKIALFEPFYI